MIDAYTLPKGVSDNKNWLHVKEYCDEQIKNVDT